MDILLSNIELPENPSLHDRILNSLESEILSGQRAPGSPINERELAEKFGVSRTPVREVLLLLSSVGLVSIRRGAGIYVHKSSTVELISLLEALTEIEGSIAKLAAKRITNELKEQLIDLQNRSHDYALNNNKEEYALINAKIHKVIYQASKNSVLVESAQNIRKRLSAYRRRGFDQVGRLEKSSDEHRKIISAINTGQPELAAEMMRDHISLGGDAMLNLLLSLDDLT